MNIRKTRRLLRKSYGGGLLSRFKKPLTMPLPISESSEYDKNKYKIIGKVSYDISSGEFAFFRSTEYIEKYLKSIISNMAKNRFPSAVKIFDFEFKSETIVIGQQEIVQYEQFGKKSVIKQPITDYKYHAAGTVVALMRPQNNITRSRAAKSRAISRNKN